MYNADSLARLFHETYERLAPTFGYETRKESAVKWEHVPDKNKLLMIAVCADLLQKMCDPLAKALVNADAHAAISDEAATILGRQCETLRRERDAAIKERDELLALLSLTRTMAKEDRARRVTAEAIVFIATNIHKS